MKQNDCTVLVMCRNATLNLAYLTGVFFEKYWRGCRFEKVLCTQTEKPDFHFFDRIIYTDDEMIWGDRLQAAMEKIRTRHVFLLAEDFFLQADVDNGKFDYCLKVMKKRGTGAVWMAEYPVFSVPVRSGSGMWRLVPKSSIYRVCLQPIVYDSDYLRRFSGLHFSPWQFERKASLISSYMKEEILAVSEPVYDSVHAWSHGMWSKEAVRLMRRSGIEESCYQHAKVYPGYLELKDRLAMRVIRMAPHIWTSIRIRQNEKNEKKLLY